MSNPIVLTSEQAEALADTGSFIAKAGYPACPADTDGDGDCAACSRYPDAHGRLNPPAEFVAAAQPCPTCDGTGDIEGRHIASWDICHVCYSTGRRVVELRVECGCGPKCRMYRWLGLFTVEVREIHDKLVSIIDPPTGVWYVITDQYTVQQRCDGHGMDTSPAILPPDAVPGDYLMVCTKVETE